MEKLLRHIYVLLKAGEKFSISILLSILVFFSSLNSFYYFPPYSLLLHALCSLPVSENSVGHILKVKIFHHRLTSKVHQHPVLKA